MYIKIKRNPAHRVILHNIVDLSMKNYFEYQNFTHLQLRTGKHRYHMKFYGAVNVT